MENNLIKEAIAARKNKMSYGKYVAAIELQKPKVGPSAKDIIRLETERYRLKNELKHYKPTNTHYKGLKRELEALNGQIGLYKAEMGLVGGLNTPMRQ